MRLTEEIKLEIVKLSDSTSMSLSEISKVLEVPKSTCYNIIKNYEKRGTVENKKSPGRPKKFTSRDENKLIQLARKYPKKNSTQLLSELNLDISVSTSLIRKKLVKNKLFARVAVAKPYLSRINRRKRFQWAKDYYSKPLDFWKNVLFSDETSIELHPNRKQYVRKPPNAKFHQKYVQPTFKFGGGKRMFWGFISWDGRKKLIPVRKNITTTTYLDLLRDNLLTEMNLHEIFQQDNAPAHKSEQTMTWFLENGVEILENWPAQSPDINIIENVWSAVKKAVYKRFPKNMTQLENFVLEEFEAYPVEKIQNLYKSIPRRLSRILGEKGLTTDY